MFSDIADDSDNAVAVDYPKLRSHAFGASFVDGQIVERTVNAVVGDIGNDEIERAYAGVDDHGIGIHFFFKLEDVSAQTYEFGLQLGILAVEVVVDFPEVEVRTYVITRAVDRR